MKVVLVIPTLQQGGAERVMSVLATEWNLAGHEVHLVLLAGSDDFYSVPDTVTIHRLGFLNKGKLQKIYAEWETLRKLRKLVRDLQPQFVLSFMEKFNEFTLLATYGLGIPVYVSDRANPERPMALFRRLMKKILYKKAHGIVAQTSFAKSILEEKVQHRNIQVIPNPVKEVSLHPDIEREKIILNVGRLVPEKGQRYLIEAFSKLDDQSWRLLILGDGPLRSELESLAESLGVSSRLDMPGAVKNVDEHLARSSIFVFPSISEGFPNALCEAMVAGLPCVAFDCNAGPRDIIVDGENGYLVPVKNVDLLVQCIKNLQLSCSKSGGLCLELPDLEKSQVASKYLTFCSNKI